MAKLTGYILAIAGLAVAILSFYLSNILPEAIKPVYVMIAGMVIVAAGVFLVLSKGSKQAAEEVPIYKGRKIVGYRKAE